MEVVSKKPHQETVLGRESTPTREADLVLLPIDGKIYVVCAAESAVKITAKRLSEIAAWIEDQEHHVFKKGLPTNKGKKYALLTRNAFRKKVRDLQHEHLKLSPLPNDSEVLQALQGVSVVPASKRAERGAIDELINRAVEVLGSRDEGMRWLGTPVRGLDFATPISMLGTKEGAVRVSDILGQMERGIW